MLSDPARRHALEQGLPRVNELDVPVVVTVRKQPRIQMVNEALFDRTSGPARKWALVERAGPLGLTTEATTGLLRATTLHA